LFNETVLLGGHRLPLLLAFHASAALLCRVLTENGKELAMPDGLPAGPEDAEWGAADDG
jgi:hypothetical protein